MSTFSVFNFQFSIKQMTGKLIIFSAPSGSGKSTIINYLLTQNLNLAFSISATSRPPRGTEKHGVEYFFLTPEEFRCRIENNEFLEYEEVYKDRYYGTLKEQVEKQLEKGQNVVFDLDVVGGCNIKKYYGERALSIFVQPPSIEELRCRLTGRGTDEPEVIECRIAKAEYEMTFAPQFDRVIVNDDLEAAKAETLEVIKESLKKRIESIEKKEGSTEKFMYLCGIIGIVDIVFGILSLYLHFWIAAGIFFLIAVRQAIVFPKWRKKLRMEREAKKMTESQG